MHPFKLYADYEPAGDQPQAIEKLVQGLASSPSSQTLLGGAILLAAIAANAVSGLRRKPDQSC